MLRLENVEEGHWHITNGNSTDFRFCCARSIEGVITAAKYLFTSAEEQIQLEALRQKHLGGKCDRRREDQQGKSATHS